MKEGPTLLREQKSALKPMHANSTLSTLLSSLILYEMSPALIAVECFELMCMRSLIDAD
jgi:hypothetical protein